MNKAVRELQEIIPRLDVLREKAEETEPVSIGDIKANRRRREEEIILLHFCRWLAHEYHNDDVFAGHLEVLMEEYLTKRNRQP